MNGQPNGALHIYFARQVMPALKAPVDEERLHSLYIWANFNSKGHLSLISTLTIGDSEASGSGFKASGK